MNIFKKLITDQFWLKDGIFEKDDKIYLNMLVKYRCFENGILGINLHGSHLKDFKSFFPCLPSGLPIDVIHIKRRDRVRQGISYLIAKQTGQWSSSFNKSNKPIYDKNILNQLIGSIEMQNFAIEKFCQSMNFKVQSICYEDMISMKPPSINIADTKLILYVKSANSMVRQSNTINESFLDKAASDYFN